MTMKPASIKRMTPMGLHQETLDPFLFCAHHKDHYPAGNEFLGPDVPLGDRPLGNDFTLKNGFRMYHGDTVPGFPEHPHRGFETVTIVLEGFVDHSDSAGAAGRYGSGDVQWMTAGSGMQHAEMFPLLNEGKDNPCELFQLWLNLPAAKKMVEPHYRMLWNEDIPVIHPHSSHGGVKLKLIAGRYDDHEAPLPAPDSWAADPASQLNIFLLTLSAGASWTLPAAAKGQSRMLYFYQGEGLIVDGLVLESHTALELQEDVAISVKSAQSETRILLLEGKPINEPVAQYGPFVMNTAEEIRQTLSDYNQTRFGGWPWNRPDPVHPADKGRFALFSDGLEVYPPSIGR
jgi:redox-sensitive bicupin YhaK (pirin superfamily)